jgi:hypothetical protein
MVTLLQAEADLRAAEARADDAQKLADNLLAQHYEEWVPHWVADGYERVRLSGKLDKFERFIWSVASCWYGAKRSWCPTGWLTARAG